MRNTLNARLLLTLSGTVLIAAGFVACGSSDDNADVTETPDAAEASAPDTSKPDTGTPDTGTPDTGPQYDAGQPIILDAGDLVEGGIACVVGGRLEEEPNDDEATANQLEIPDAAAPYSRCGVVVFQPDGGDAGDGGTENDFLTFTLKGSTQSFFLQFAGDVKMDVKVDGSAPVTIGAGLSPNVPFVRDQPYFIRVYSSNGKQQTWRVSLFEQ